MVDAARIAALLHRLTAETAHLRRLADHPDGELSASEYLLPAAKYRLIVAIEIAIDVCDHIVATEGLRPATSLRDSFRPLREAEWLDASLSSSLEDAAGLRNLLVHQYAEIDDPRVIEILRTRMDDLDAFASAIAGRVSED